MEGDPEPPAGPPKALVHPRGRENGISCVHESALPDALPRIGLQAPGKKGHELVHTQTSPSAGVFLPQEVWGQPREACRIVTSLMQGCGAELAILRGL